MTKLYAQRQQATRALTSAIRRADVADIQLHTQQLSACLQEFNLLRQLLPKDRPSSNVFVFSSMLLHDSFDSATELPQEGMHFVVGYEYDNLLIATRIIPFAYAHRSLAAARGDHQATHHSFIETHEFGHSLLALIHSHPGTGTFSNHPSGEDMQTQRNWELTTKMISGIWSRDGYLRFFSDTFPFSIVVVGSQIEQLEPHLWRLRHEDREDEDTPLALQASCASSCEAQRY